MLSKKTRRICMLRKIVSLVISLSMLTTIMPIQSVQAQEYGERGSISAIKEMAEKYQQDLLNLELEVGVEPIQEDVDVLSEEEQAIIVEFKALPKIMFNALNDGQSTYNVKSSEVEQEHEAFNKFLVSKAKEKSTSTYVIDHAFYDTFNGVTMKVKGTDIPTLLESGVVKTIWKDETVTVEPSVNYEESINEVSSRMATSNPLIGVDKLWEEGITGKGIKVGVLDTGIDYNHPDLKDNYRPGGYDFVNDDNDPMETTYEDWKNSGEKETNSTGNTYYTFHGTHVSGTIAANGKNTESEYAVTGVAPEAELYGYKVLGPYGQGSSSDIMAAIEKSVEDGMNVINMSLGTITPNPLYPSSVACNNASIAGVVTVVSNGNAGPEISSVGAPATSALAISVGASTTNISIDKFVVTTSNGVTLNGNLMAKPFAGVESILREDNDIIYGGYGSQEELKGLDVKGKILFIDRGNLSFADKFKYAREAGALGVIIANNVSGSINLYFGESVNMIPVISMSMEDGEKLKSAIKTETIKVNLALNGKTTTEPDKLADFSSRGPSMDETIKPDITAPGVGIFSTYPEYINSPEDGIDYGTAYARIDGTSMAAPHIAGVAALILQEHEDYTPEEVKVAMMNTAEELAETYGVNEMGAGRINAYEAVHSEISIKVLDVCASLDEDYNKIQIDYITGSMSFDRIAKKDVDTTKKLDLEISNSGNVDKKFNISVEFLNKESMGTKNAADNGVSLSIAESTNVKVGEKVNLEAAINVPATAEVGRYEGFVIFTNAEDSTEDYRIPFSVIYLTPGVEYVELSRPAMSNDLDMMHFAKIPGITGTLRVSSPISRIDLYIKDYETQKTIGYLGSSNASDLPPGYDARMQILSGRGNYFPVNEDGSIEYVLRNLTDGKYIIEIVAIDAETSEKYTLYKNILIDNEDAKMTFDREAGVYEITEDMFTIEEFAGQDYEAFWVKGNVTDNSIAELNEMGYKVDASSIQMPAFVGGYPRMSLQVAENGDFKFGIEMSDINYGVYEFAPMPVDIATAQNMFLQPRYFFVKEGAPYYSTTLNKDEIAEGENITATIGIHNVTGSSFETALEYFEAFEVINIRVSEQLQKIVDENNYKVNISKNITGDVNKSLSLKLEVFDKEGNPVDISGTISLIDVELNLVSDAESEFYREYIQCKWMNVLDKEGNYVDISYSGTYEGVDIKQQTSAIRVPQLAEGFYECLKLNKYTTELDKYIWLEDANGKRYDLEYLKSRGEYYVTNLPASEEEMTVFTSMPGHFKKVGKFVPSRVLDGEIVGKVYYMLGEEFFRIISGGDTNDDGVIDIYDAIAVEKYYGQSISLEENEKLQVDFNFDGVVNAYDMDYIVDNYTDYNEQIALDKKPVLTLDGRDLEDVLETTGYSSEVRLEGMKISKTSLSLEVGQSEKLTATIRPENVENIGLKWYSDNKNIATVDDDGNITAVSPGTTYIRVSTSDNRVTLSCKVNVCIDGKVPAIKKVTIEEQNREVYVGDEFELNFNIDPYNTLPYSVKYISSADSIVSVENGKAVANKPGKVFVTLDINYGMFIETWEINVNPIAIKSIELNKNKLELEKGSSEQLEVTIKPENATNKNVTWTSSDEKVATVVDGKVVAVGKGEAIITVTSEDGGFTDTCKVSVTDKESEIIPTKSIKLNKNKLELEKGSSELLEVTFKPENATNKNVTWISSDEKVATVTDGKIVAVGKGKAVITVTSEDGGFTDTCKVSVTDKESEIILTKSIKLNKNKLELEKGNSEQLEVTFKPENATNKNVTWTSSDEKVATVVDGKIVAVGKGKAVITVTSEDGGFTDTCKVTVTEKDTSTPETPEKPNKPSLPQTGAVAGATMAMTIGAIAVGAGLFLKKKRN